MREEANATQASSRAARGVSALVGGAKRAVARALLLRRRGAGRRGAVVASLSAAALYDSTPSDSADANDAWPPAAWLQQQVGGAFAALQQQAAAASAALFAAPLLPAARPAAAAGAGALPCVDTSNTLPATLPGADAGAHHALVAVGHRHWGGPAVSGLLRVKIYDFAVYADAAEARAALADAFTSGALAGGGAGGEQRRKRRWRRRGAAEASVGAEGAAAEGGKPVSGEPAAAAATEAANGDGGWQLPLPQLALQLPQVPVAWWAAAQGGASAEAEATSADAGLTSDSASTEDAPRRRHLPRLRLRRRASPPAAGADGATSPVAAAAADPSNHYLAAAPAGAGGGGAAAALPDALKARGDCGVSLLLRAARDIPLSALREEYEKVLRRRLARVGGDPSDPALAQLLDCFSDARRLPPDAVAGSGAAVRRGASIVFRRRGPVVEALVGDRHLGSITSPHLGEALFDLYLGSQPVSAPAKAAAADTLARILEAAAPDAGGGGVFYAPRASERLRCAGDGSDARACVVEL